MLIKRVRYFSVQTLISVLGIILFSMLTISPIGVLADSEGTNAEFSEEVQVLLDKLEDIELYKKLKPEKYSLEQDIDISLKLMLRFVAEGNAQSASHYLTRATGLIQSEAEMAEKTKDTLKSITNSFTVWKSSKSQAVYETMQKDVNSLLLIVDADLDTLAGQGTAVRLWVIVGVVILLAIIVYFLFIR